MDIKEAAQQVRSLISDDCDRCHVHWLTLQDMLKDVLQ